MTRPPSVPRSPRPEVSQGRAGGPGLPSAPRGLGAVSSRRRSRLCLPAALTIGAPVQRPPLFLFSAFPFPPDRASPLHPLAPSAGPC